MIIETERLIIRPLKLGDEIPFINMASDGSLEDVGFGIDCREWMKSWIVEAKKLTDKDNPLTDYLAYTVILKAKNSIIGSVGCSYYDDLQETGITYFIDFQYRGNGYAAEAAKAYAMYFFEHYNIQKLIATIKKENIASQKTVEKSDFRFIEKRSYQDICDKKEEQYYFYEMISGDENLVRRFEK